MHDFPIPPDALQTFDSFCADYVDDCRDRAQAGALVARRDIEALVDLAAAIAGSVAAWAPIVERLDLGRTAAFDPRRAQAMIVEGVFDDRLTGDALRILDAALALDWR
ncbi:MAG: hypothetical protein ABI376_01690 [Caulobacteraceae bacterium]